MLRVIFAVKIGPDVLFYGTGMKHRELITDQDREKKEWLDEHHNVMGHNNICRGYTKYYPNQKRADTDKGGKTFDVTINSRGFRGDEFRIEKLDGCLRIITLGASSTFGYGDRDDETYPFYLEKMLSRDVGMIQCDGIKTVEVINQGIPHLKSEQIYALFLHEALPLKPDIVTIYAGANDSAREPFDAPDDPIKDKLARRLLLVEFGVSLLPSPTYTYRQFQEHLKGKKEHFLEYYSEINESCIKNGIQLYAITQQGQSMIIDPDEIKAVTYRHEVDIIRNKIQRESITNNELRILTHSHLMAAMRKWAHDNSIILVDGIRALDHSRDCLSSWVHLNPEGNVILARELANSIITHYRCD